MPYCGGGGAVVGVDTAEDDGITLDGITDVELTLIFGETVGITVDIIDVVLMFTGEVGII